MPSSKKECIVPVGNPSGTLLSARFSASSRVVAARRRCTTPSPRSAKICSKSAALKAGGILRRQRDVASGRVSRHIAVGATLPGPASRWSRGQTGETERNCAGQHYERRFARIDRDLPVKCVLLGKTHGYSQKMPEFLWKSRHFPITSHQRSFTFPKAISGKTIAVSFSSSFPLHKTT